MFNNSSNASTGRTQVHKSKKRFKKEKEILRKGHQQTKGDSKSLNLKDSEILNKHQQTLKDSIDSD